jgi:single-stranded-DNA-specific exonuclease
VDRLDRAGHQKALAIAQQHDLPDLLARVLAGRGVGPDGVGEFLAPSLRALLPDPLTLAGMDTASARIAAAIRTGEKVVIFGDYDVDGAASSALLSRFMRWNGLDPVIHIPDRITEGYGPNIGAITSFAEAGAQLLVTVDCGSASVEALDHARSVGLDALVIDHHQLGETLPAAVAVVNPNRQDDLSGQGHLAAVGVVFLVIVAVNRLLRDAGWYTGARSEPDLRAWLDLVALGTVADVVPLVGLNRAYVRQGLSVMRQRATVGLSALADVARLNGPVDCYHLGFLLGPRINAGGRIGDAGLGVRLLLSEDPEEAAALSSTLDRLNSERQEIEQRAVEEAVAQVEAAQDSRARSVLIVQSDADWHPGIVGLVAARLKERYQRPVFAITFAGGGVGSGSGRSIRGVDLGRAVRAAVSEGLLIKGGGHAMAAGLTVARERLGDFTAFLEERLVGEVAETDVSALELDAALTARGAGAELVTALDDGEDDVEFCSPPMKAAC